MLVTSWEGVTPSLPVLFGIGNTVDAFFSIVALLIAVVVVCATNFSVVTSGTVETLRPLRPSLLNDDYFAFVLTVLWLFLLLLFCCDVFFSSRC